MLRRIGPARSAPLRTGIGPKGAVVASTRTAFAGGTKMRPKRSSCPNSKPGLHALQHTSGAGRVQTPAGEAGVKANGMPLPESSRRVLLAADRNGCCERISLISTCMRFVPRFSTLRQRDAIATLESRSNLAWRAGGSRLTRVARCLSRVAMEIRFEPPGLELSLQRANGDS